MLNSYSVRAIAMKNNDTGERYWLATASRSATVVGQSVHGRGKSADKAEACLAALSDAISQERPT
jgi:hypothetical protein